MTGLFMQKETVIYGFRVPFAQVALRIILNMLNYAEHSGMSLRSIKRLSFLRWINKR